MNAVPTVFLDRDGCLNEDRGYVHRFEGFVFTPGAPQAIKALNDAGFRVIVVSNQSGIARGYYRREDVDELHRCVAATLAREGAHVAAFYYCPHHPDFGDQRQCRCRKPSIGMFEDACRDFEVDRDHSWAVGDKPSDIEFARRAGLRAVLIGDDRNAGPVDVVARTLRGAADVILRTTTSRQAE